MLAECVQGGMGVADERCLRNGVSAGVDTGAEAVEVVDVGPEHVRSSGGEDVEHCGGVAGMEGAREAGNGAAVAATAGELDAAGAEPSVFGVGEGDVGVVIAGGCGRQARRRLRIR